VYAGAAREAVFANPEVIRRVHAEFVPLALRAPLVHGADTFKDEDEKWLYQRINRAKLAPQGIGVLDAKGQVLTWVQTFDNDRSVLDFLDHSRKRFQETANVEENIVTERYLKFPSGKVADYQDQTPLPAVLAQGHPKGRSCPAKDGKGKVQPGLIRARLVGRALDGQGNLFADTVKQEHYVEDQFPLTPAMQRALTSALAKAGTEWLRLPEDFGKLCGTHAHLGHIDVQPCLCLIKNQAENKGEWRQCAFQARKSRVGQETILWRVEGQSEVVSEVAVNGRGVHDIKLAWEGFIETRKERVTKLVLSARGKERLQFAKDDHPLKKLQADEVAFLPAGRPIDVDCGVRYGILGEPTAVGEAEEPVPAKSAGPTETAGFGQEVPDEMRKQLVEALGGGVFLVFRDPVMEELKLSDEQKQKLQEQFPDFVQATMHVFEKIQDAKPEDREKEMQAHRQKSEAKLTSFLKDVLDDKQRARLFQLQLQQAGVFALLGENEAFKPLKITAQQRKRFVELVQDMQKKLQATIQEAGKDPKPEEILPRVRKIRKEYAGKLEALLSAGQIQAWKDLLGKPLELGD
jgi:hypothetical protein